MIEIRDAVVSDAHPIAALHIASWRVAYRGLLPEDALSALSVTDWEGSRARVLREPRPRSGHLVVTEGRDIHGFAAMGPSRDPGAARGTGELYALYVHPDRWRHGTGSRLHAAALQRLGDLGFTESTLWVLDGNDRALAFYRQAGWSDDDRSRLATGPGGVELHERRLRRLLTHGA